MVEQRPELKAVGDYDLVEKIAEGGMGTVYKAKHRSSGQITAIKVLAPHMANNEVLLKRFEKEYNTARQLDHPNIVRALEYGKSEGAPYLVMEFVEGETLGQRISRHGAIPEKEAIRLIAQVAQGLQRAHKGKLVHRDVKPDNILVTREGTAKLADLGLVKEVEADLNLTRTGRGLGTPHFMAPEQFKNAKNADPRCDIYSLGATLYMMVTGELPFRSQGPLDAYMKKIENKFMPPRELVSSLSERIDWAIRRSMSADPEQRPSTCREFVEDLTGRSVRKPTSPAQAQANKEEIWYLVYKDEEGVNHTAKGSTVAIRRSLREGLLGDASNIRASKLKDGEFLMLREFPEFRDLVILPQPMVNTPVEEATKPSTPALPPSRPRPAPTVLRANQPGDSVRQRTAGAPQDEQAGPLIKFPETKKNANAWGLPFWAQCLILAGIVAISAAIGLFVFKR